MFKEEKNMKKTIFVLILILFLFSCKSFRELKSFAKCEFKYKNLENVCLAGIQVENKHSLKDFPVRDGIKLIGAVSNNQFLLNLVVNLDVTNPNSEKAAMNGGDWIFFIDGKEMLRGNINQRIEINPNSTVVLPINIEIDLKKILTKKSARAIVNFGLGLSNKEEKTTRVSLWIKPIIKIGKRTMKYPDYIRLGKKI